MGIWGFRAEHFLKKQVFRKCSAVPLGGDFCGAEHLRNTYGTLSAGQKCAAILGDFFVWLLGVGSCETADSAPMRAGARTEHFNPAAERRQTTEETRP